MLIAPRTAIVPILMVLLAIPLMAYADDSTPTAAATPGATETPTAATETVAPTTTATLTPQPTSTSVPTATPTKTAVAAATSTRTPTSTATPAPTRTAISLNRSSLLITDSGGDWSDIEVPEPEGNRKENHGWFVSFFAHIAKTLEDVRHGLAVSFFAHPDADKDGEKADSATVAMATNTAQPTATTSPSAAVSSEGDEVEKAREHGKSDYSRNSKMNGKRNSDSGNTINKSQKDNQKETGDNRSKRKGHEE